VTVPAEAEITLDVMLIQSVRRTDGPERAFHSSVSIKRRGADGPVEFVAEDSESWKLRGAAGQSISVFCATCPPTASPTCT